jgi:lipopolysaccharide/colanic/teichoic acid biosynthesis glycosyltransferase
MGLDRLLALGMMLLLVPVGMVLAAAIVAADRVVPIVGLPRIGQHGRSFTMWKLRTMREAEGTPPFTVVDDTRVTSFGRWLRHYRLDELPQLWNVVRGEMALVGPRPEAPEFVDPADPQWEPVLAVRPGIVGPTQVVVHRWEATITSPERYTREVLVHKLAIDAWYASHASPSVDLEVLRSVVRSVTVPAASTPVHRRLRAELPETMAAIERAAGSWP